MKVKLGEIYSQIKEKENRLIIKYGDKKKDGDFEIKPGHKNFNEFQKEMEAFLNSEIEMPFSLGVK